MMRRIKSNQVHHVLITVVIAVVEFALVNFLVWLGLAPGGKVDSTLSMMLTVISYLIISGTFLKFNKPRGAMWTAILAFVFLCIFLFYAVTITDILAFIVTSVMLLSSMTVIDIKIKDKEEKENKNS